MALPDKNWNTIENTHEDKDRGDDDPTKEAWVSIIFVHFNAPVDLPGIKVSNKKYILKFYKIKYSNNKSEVSHGLLENMCTKLIINTYI